MQSIERYGVVALLFLIVTVAAVLMWGDGRERPAQGRQSTVARTEGSVPRPGNTVFRAKTAAQRSAPLTDERARRREQRRAQGKSEVQDRYGVPTPEARANGQIQGSGAGLVPGGSPRGTGLGRTPEEEYEAAEEFRAAQVAALEQTHPQQTSGQVGAPASDPKPEVRKRGRGKKSRAGVAVYTVRKRDVLGTIAQRELGSVKRMQEIIDLNPGLDPNKIRAGLELRMPSDWTGAASAAVAATNPSSRSGRAADPQAEAPAGLRAYVVKKNDSLWGIAESQLGRGSRYKEIEAANPKLAGGVIKPGQTIFLPARSSAPSTPAPGPRVAARTQNSERSTRARGKVH